MLLLKFVALLPLVSAWGELGHRTVAYLAQKHLTTPAQSWVNDILQGEDISTAAIWPDEIKNKTKYGDRYSYSKPWHFYNVKGSFDASCTLNSSDIPAACQKNHGCAIEAIANNTEVAMNKINSNAARAEGLKFVMHIIGDLHQPLHTEALASGGNGICINWGNARRGEYDDSCKPKNLDNLHAVWDDFIPETLVQEKYNITPDAVSTLRHSTKFKDAAKQWAEKLYDAHDKPEVCSYATAQQCAFNWAQDSNQLVCRNVLANGKPSTTEDLSKSYYDANKDVVEAQVKRAGLRLAAWINKMAVASPLLQTQMELKRRVEY